MIYTNSNKISGQTIFLDYYKEQLQTKRYFSLSVPFFLHILHDQARILYTFDSVDNA